MSQDKTPDPTQQSPELERVLVVISPDLVKPGSPEKSPLLSRALYLAKETGCELELFHVCYDEVGPANRFKTKDDIRLEQQKVFDLEKKQMIKLAENLHADGVTVKEDTRWEPHRADAILQKIADAQPNLVLKQSRGHNYLLGITSNTDWDLIRQSPAHLWFVADKQVSGIDRLVTAVGTNTDADDIFGDVDYDVFRLANFVAEALKAQIVPVHAFQEPAGWSAYAAYAPVFGGAVHATGAALPDPQKQLEDIAKKHGKSIEAFAEYFQIQSSNIRLALGNPSEIISAVAAQEKAELIVMAARNLSRWERFRETTTAERVLSATPCDVLFVKDQSPDSNIGADTQ